MEFSVNIRVKEEVFMEFIKVVILPALGISTVALVVMLTCHLNSKWRHLVGRDPEMQPKKRKEEI